jgi:hypothetical protein
VLKTKRDGSVGTTYFTAGAENSARVMLNDNNVSASVLLIFSLTVDPILPRRLFTIASNSTPRVTFSSISTMTSPGLTPCVLALPSCSTPRTTVETKSDDDKERDEQWFVHNTSIDVN